MWAKTDRVGERSEIHRQPDFKDKKKLKDAQQRA